MIYLISQIHSQSDQTENDLAYNIISGFKIQFNAINSIQFMSKQVKSILCELNSTTIITTTTNTTTTYYLLPTTYYLLRLHPYPVWDDTCPTMLKLWLVTTHLVGPLASLLNF